MPRGTRPVCWPALLGIHCRLTGEIIAMKALAAFWMRLLAFTLLVMIAGILLIEREPPPKTVIGGDGLPSAGTLSPVYAAPIQVKLVDLIPASLSGEANQDSEPFLAIQTANPQVMVASAFTPNPVSSTGNAPVYVSQDGGNSWVLNAITPVPRMTCDITHAMPTGENHPRGDLHAGTLACAASITLDESESNDVSSSAVMNVQSTRSNVDQPFVQALRDPSDKLPGRLVVKRVSIPWSNAPTLGQERIGSTLSIAVDPNNSSTVYVGWADRGRKGDIYTLHVRRSTDRGLTWSKADLPHTTISNATNIALAVANNGVVGFLYQQLSGSRWVTHIVQSHDAFTTAQDFVLATVPANEPAEQFLPYLGDYDYLLLVGNEFRGVFCANNRPDLANFPQGVTYQRAADFTSKTLNDGSGNPVAISIDPFYFSVPVIP